MTSRTERGALRARIKLEALKVLRGYTSYEQIADEFGVEVRTVKRFKEDPYQVRGLYLQIDEALRDALSDAGITEESRWLT